MNRRVSAAAFLMSLLALAQYPVFAVDIGDTLKRSIQSKSSQPADSGELPTVTRFSREQWGLSEAEWSRYLALMCGIRGSVSPATLSPLEVLGIHAETDAERHEYATRFARIMKDDAERVLAFQHAYDAAWRELYPDLPVVDARLLPAQGQGPTAGDPVLAAGDRLMFFTRVKGCAECERDLAVVRGAAETARIQLDVYFVDAASDEDIRQWAKRHARQFNRQLGQAGRITFNYNRSELERAAGPAATVPKIVRVRGNALTAVEPHQLIL